MSAIRRIMLTQAMFAILDDEDFERVAPHKWRFLGNPGGLRRYAVCDHNGRLLYMHRLVANAPPSMDVDHVDGNGLNNRRANLRVCTRQQNLRNMRPRGGRYSRFKGVAWDKNAGHWLAGICVDQRRCYLGCFREEIEAAQAYDKAARAVFGAFARLNFPE